MLALGFESLTLRAMQSTKDAARKCSVFAYMGFDVESLLSEGDAHIRKKGLSGPYLCALLPENEGKGRRRRANPVIFRLSCSSV